MTRSGDPQRTMIFSAEANRIVTRFVAAYRKVGADVIGVIVVAVRNLDRQFGPARILGRTRISAAAVRRGGEGRRGAGVGLPAPVGAEREFIGRAGRQAGQSRRLGSRSRRNVYPVIAARRSRLIPEIDVVVGRIFEIERTAQRRLGLTDWEWYSEPNTARLFFHLLLTANWQEKQWQGITIRPGQLVTSQSQLAKQLDLSVRNIRTSLEHLQATGYLTVKTGSKYSIVTIENYASLVGSDRQSDRQATGNRQAADNNLTSLTNQQANKSSSAAAPEPTGRPTTSPLVSEFEQDIGKLSASGKRELTGYADRLGEELARVILRKCIDAGAHSWAYVRKALIEAETQGCKSAEEYRMTNPIGAGRNRRVDRPEPSGNDFLKNAARRRPLTKKKEEPHVPET